MEPYYAVIFTSQRTDKEIEEYQDMSLRMVELVSSQPGFIRFNSIRNQEGHGITISYWRDLESIQMWKKNMEHQVAQAKGKSDWYSKYEVQICQVLREYSLE